MGIPPLSQESLPAPIRPARAEDAEAIIGLMHHLHPGGTPADPAHFRTLIDHPGTTILTATEADRPVACLTLHILPNMTRGGAPYALIENVVTRTDRRGRGIGRHLMQAALDFAAAEGCYKVMLLTQTVRGAIGFYEKCGFDSNDKTGMIRRLG